MENKLRLLFDKWIKTLNGFEIAYLEKKYIKENSEDLDYKDFDTWLFDRWSIKNVW